MSIDVKMGAVLDPTIKCHRMHVISQALELQKQLSLDYKKSFANLSDAIKFAERNGNDQAQSFWKLNREYNLVKHTNFDLKVNAAAKLKEIAKEFISNGRCYDYLPDGQGSCEEEFHVPWSQADCLTTRGNAWQNCSIDDGTPWFFAINQETDSMHLVLMCCDIFCFYTAYTVSWNSARAHELKVLTQYKTSYYKYIGSKKKELQDIADHISENGIKLPLDLADLRIQVVDYGFPERLLPLTRNSKCFLILPGKHIGYQERHVWSDVVWFDDKLVWIDYDVRIAAKIFDLASQVKASNDERTRIEVDDQIRALDEDFARTQFC